MESYENKELLMEAAKQSLAKLKDLEPGTDEYNSAANTALKLYDMQLKGEAQESDQNLKTDDERRKEQEVINDQEKAAKARHLEIAKLGISCGSARRYRTGRHWRAPPYRTGCITRSPTTATSVRPMWTSTRSGITSASRTKSIKRKKENRWKVY